MGLHIVNKRIDGFHELDTLMLQIPFRDILELIQSDKDEFSSSGLTIDGDSSNNLCVRALSLLRKHHVFPPVKMHLHKIIPMGAGLGGGSADASYVLLGINTLFNLDLSVSQLQAYAAELGSDCPLFILPDAQLAQGRGEVLRSYTGLNLSGLYLKLVNVGIHVSTKDAFSNVQFYSGGGSIESLIEKDLELWSEILENGFESSVFERYPVLREEKEALYRQGAVYASMTGSGSTLFGLFYQKPEEDPRHDVFSKVVQL